jgi:hypothetical protein
MVGFGHQWLENFETATDWIKPLTTTSFNPSDPTSVKTRPHHLSLTRLLRVSVGLYFVAHPYYTPTAPYPNTIRATHHLTTTRPHLQTTINQHQHQLITSPPLVLTSKHQPTINQHQLSRHHITTSVSENATTRNQQQVINKQRHVISFRRVLSISFLKKKTK